MFDWIIARMYNFLKVVKCDLKEKYAVNTMNVPIGVSRINDVKGK